MFGPLFEAIGNVLKTAFADILQLLLGNLGNLFGF